MKKIFLSFLPFLSLGYFTAQAQLVVSPQTPESLVQNVLTGGGVTIQNVTFNGNSGVNLNPQIGYFNGVNTNIGLDSGLILATGSYNFAVGPNNTGSGSNNNIGVPLNTDPDLQQIVGPGVFDCAILEFDFIPIGDTVRFRYVFSSEEYDEFVCSGFNDVFGFFISGPGINGPFTNNAENIALVPGTNTPVAINTINSGVPGSNGNASNCNTIDPNWSSYNIYYVNNNAGPTIQYDAFTVVLEAVSAVQCNQTYHLKIAIADAGDNGYDSGVFLEANSLTSLGVAISAITTTGDSTLIEGCNAAYFIIDRPTADSTLQLQVSFSGTATNGVDINMLPSSITLPAGVFIDTLAVQAFFDGITEGVETVEISILYPTPCGLDSVTATLYIQDVDSLKATAVKDTLICTESGETAPLNVTAIGGYGTYTYLWTSAPTDTLDTVNVSPPNTTEYTVTVTDACGNVAVSNQVTVQVQCPIVIPNVVSPNGDGLNDLFVIKNIEDYPGNEIWIYNRWGALIYHTTDYNNTFDMSGFVEGVYYYVVDNKVQKPFPGFLSLFK